MSNSKKGMFGKLLEKMHIKKLENGTNENIEEIKIESVDDIQEKEIESVDTVVEKANREPKAEVVFEAEKTEKILKEESKQVEVKVSSKTPVMKQSSVTVKKQKNKSKKKSAQAENVTIGEEFSEEMLKLKINAIKHNDLKELDRLENLEDKEKLDFRAKMQLIFLLRKNGMKNVADNKLKKESEIYDKINQMCKYKKEDYRYDNIMCEILEEVSMMDGKNDYAYKLLDKVDERVR